jgi:hypothetical protein
MARSKKRSNSSGSGWFGYIILIGIGLVVSPGSSLVLAAGMMPTLVAMFVTTGHSSNQRLMTIATFNLAGVLPFAFEVFFGETGAGEVLSDVFSWAVMMGAAGFGTALNYFGPILAAQVLTSMAASDQKTLIKVREKIVAEWGEAVLKDGPPAQNKAP